MCTFKITNYPHKQDIDTALKLGGPSLTKQIEVDGLYRPLYITHNLLHVTGEATPQPVYVGGKYYMLMGEVYNYDKTLASDIYHVINSYEKYGDDFTNYLDGEFLIVIYDSIKKHIDFFTDPWSTRQAWFHEFDEYFYFGTFPMYEPKNFSRFSRYPDKDDEWYTKFMRLKHNSHYRYILHPHQNDLIHMNDSLHVWNLDQYKNDYKDWDAAFEQAVDKRWHNNMCLHLSGGVDSTCIALCLADLQKHFKSITLALTDSEDEKTIWATRNYTIPYNENVVIDSPEITREFETERKRINLNGRLDNSKSHITNVYMVEKTKKMNCIVTLKGNGADEIIGNYINKPNRRSSEQLSDPDFTRWPEDLYTIFPWRHFYGGLHRKILDNNEFYFLAYGIEIRNVYCDKKLTQEWLNISSDLKNTEEKSPLKNYLRERDIVLPTKMAWAGLQARKSLFKVGSNLL